MNPSAGTLQFLCHGGAKHFGEESKCSTLARCYILSIKNLTSGEMKARNSPFSFGGGKNFTFESIAMHDLM